MITGANEITVEDKTEVINRVLELLDKQGSKGFDFRVAHATDKLIDDDGFYKYVSKDSYTIRIEINGGADSGDLI